ncbi:MULTISPECIES: ABC transporter ATPase [Tenacibaculum]|uniref:ABC transporter ATPase n=1 Tax=Tenacibaculum TaxID=104267 RepID=UPI0021AEF6B7|nr:MULTISPECIES: ABC transporter ATPase [Tenacibaculum]MCT4698011.1 ABC transporter ATPase [Tenacibaculum haliotis]WBX72132.1 ABC transporter ATPase [Tenacibaculum retecalamus]
MFTEYNNLPTNSRVWIYQADREFSIEEVEYICAKTILFIDNWTRHGDDLKGSFTIKYNQFLILGVDEGFNDVSGCSIDSSVHFVQELEKELRIDLMNKMNVSFKDGDNINVVKLSDFQQLAKDKKITSKTIVFNNMVDTKEDFETNWEVTADKSWHKRFLV